MAGIVMQRFLVRVMTVIATVLFQLGRHVGPDIDGCRVAHVAFSL